MLVDKNEIKSIELVAESLLNGKVVIIPTDTVYGFSGIVDLKNSIQYKTDSRIREIKGRDENKPLIQLISEPEEIFKYTSDEIPDRLLSKWPGALTVIVNCRKDNPQMNEFETIAFRCPGDEWLRKIISEVKAPVFSTSVNRSGKPVLDEIKLIKDEFENDVSLIVDDGDKKGALPSTIVSVAGGTVKILRQGNVIVG